MTRRPRAAFTRASICAHEMIELLLREMRRGLEHPQLQETLQWSRVFGEQSAVASLQKLVQALAVLPAEGDANPNMLLPAPAEPDLSAEEMEMLAAWLAQQD